MFTHDFRMVCLKIKRLTRISITLLIVLGVHVDYSFGKDHSEDNLPIKEIQFVDNQRLLNWCVTGDDEPEFNYYPFSDFIPYFKKTQRRLVRTKDQSNIARYDYDFDVTGARYKEASSIKGELQNTGHFRFKSYILRESPLGIKEQLRSTKIEGLAVQINWAPSGIGLPADFAFVDQDEDIVCFDCTNQYGVPLGCRRRTHNSIIHPTILVYHHKMRIPAANKVRIQERLQMLKEDEEGEFKRNEERKKAIGGGGPEGPIAPPTIEPETECDSRFSKDRECIVRNLYVDDDSDPRNYMGLSYEVHGTLKWFLPPCSTTKGIEFQFLVIHSFARQDYEAFTLGPYEIPTDLIRTTLNTNKHNPFIPSPFFHGFQRLIECDNEENTILISRHDYSSLFRHPFDYSRSYEQCLRDIDGFRSTVKLPQVCAKPEPLKCDHEKTKFQTRVDSITICSAMLCESSKMTTPRPIQKKSTKRGIHGGINMVTNFCLQPIFIFIGRYYKETFNRCSCKGGKLWYWIHMLGGGAASICQYVGYFHPKYVEESFHVYAGHIMIMMLGFTYVSAWIRHKSPWATAAAEFIHGVSGYIVSGLAYWCLHTAPGVSFTALCLIYTSTAILGVGYIIMEACICTLDRKFGMQPQRRHLPTVEARFDDLPVPQNGLRITLLVCITIPMFILTMVSNFV